MCLQRYKGICAGRNRMRFRLLIDLGGRNYASFRSRGDQEAAEHLCAYKGTKVTARAETECDFGCSSIWEVETARRFVPVAIRRRLNTFVPTKVQSARAERQSIRFRLLIDAKSISFMWRSGAIQYLCAYKGTLTTVHPSWQFISATKVLRLFNAMKFPCRFR